MKEMKEFAQVLSAGDIEKAFVLRKKMELGDGSITYELDEIVRQTIISFLKKGLIYKARDAERKFHIPKNVLDETVRQAVLSSLRDGDIPRIKELRETLPISESLGQELLEYCASWGKPNYTNSMRAVFA